MRLTLAGHAGCPDADLDVADGVRLGDLRTHLAAVTGRAELATGGRRAAAPLAVGDVVLDDDQLTGHGPLVAGAVLRVGAGAPDPDRLALRRAWYAAVVAGPDSGALVPLDVGVVVGRRSPAPGAPVGRAGGPGGARPGRLPLDDAALSLRHVEILPGGSGPRARDLASRNGTRLTRAPRPGRGGGRTTRLGPHGRRLRAGDRLLLGASVLEIRSAGTAPWTPTSSARPTAPATPSSWVAPAAGALVLAAATGNRMLLALAAVGPVTALGTSAVARVRVRAGDRRWPARRGSGATLPTGARLPVAADLRRDVLAALGERPAHPPGPDAPGDAGHRAPTGRRDPVPAGPVRPGLDELAVDGCVAVVGPRTTALAVARLLACAQAGRGIGGEAGDRGASGAGIGGEAGDRGASGARPPVGTVAVRVEDDRAATWRWARWLAARDGGAPDLVVLDHLGGRPARAPGPPAVPPGPGTGARVLVLAPVPSGVPPWCRTVLAVSDDGRTVRVTRPGTPAVGVPVHGVSEAWAERQARLLCGWGGDGAHARPGDAAPRWAAGPGAAARRRGDPPGAGGAGPEAVGRGEGTGPPATVALADLPGIPGPDAEEIRRAWACPEAPGEPGGRAAPRGLSAVLGRGARGTPVVLDLVREGPHGLVAGTTGAGKSGLLQTWLLSLALTRSPADLAVLLVDHKGGASFGLCAGLPHVVAQVTDLDAALAARALASLRAELRRREGLLARWAVPDLDALRVRAPDAAPPRLLVVVDEFRALLDDLPDFVPGLLRVAAQGRSLGMHLLLATQRPAGAVSGDLRANLAVRVALRVTDPADSLDVLDAPDAAAIPADLVGRAVLRRGGRAHEPLQVAHAETAPVGSHPPVRRVGDERGPRGWTSPVARESHGGPPGPPDRARGLDATRTAAWVEAACAAAAAAGIPRPAPPWLPPLPERLMLADLSRSPALAGGAARRGGPSTDDPTRPDADTNPDPDRLAYALADHPAHQRRSVVAWHPWSGPLLVLGGARSGRTTALHTLATAALGRGWDVHAALGAGGPWASDGTDLGHPAAQRGTVVTADDPRRLARLLTLLARAPGDLDRGPHGPGAPRPVLLLVDGVEAVLAALGTVARGRAVDLLLDVLRDGRHARVAVAATASPGLSPAVARLFTDRVVLRLGDPLAEATAGVPSELVGVARTPGRGVRLPGAPAPGDVVDTAAMCQVAIAPARPATPAPGRAGTPSDPVPRLRPAPRLRPVPRHVTAAALAAAVTAGRPGPDRPVLPPGAVPIGLGGDDAGPVLLGVDRGALVVGPAGSGRSTALAAVARALLDRGTEVAIVARDGPALDVGEVRAPARTRGHRPAAVAALLDDLARPDGGAPVVVLVDDVDLLDQRAPDLARRLADAAAAADGPSAARRVVVVASAQTAAAAMAFRGVLGTLRSGRRGVVLQPAEPGSAEVFGVDLGWDVDPARPHAPGSGVAVDARRTEPVQVADVAAH